MARRRPAKKVVTADIREVPGRQLTCRVHHDWPSEDVEDGKKLPRGVYVELVDEAADLWRLMDVCRRCGKTRWKPMPERRVVRCNWNYIDPPDWVKLTLKFTQGDAYMENMQRNLAKLFPAGAETGVP